jgi:hypothetical protein
MVIARFELLDEDGGTVEPYAHDATPLDHALSDLIVILFPPVASNQFATMARHDLDFWRWIVEFDPYSPTAADGLMGTLYTISHPAEGALKATLATQEVVECITLAWQKFVLYALLAGAAMLEIDMPGATTHPHRVLLPRTFTERITIEEWQVIPMVDTCDCLVSDGKILHGITLEALADYDAVALEIAYADDNADMTDLSSVAVRAERRSFAIIQDGEIVLHGFYETGFFVTGKRQQSAGR